MVSNNRYWLGKNGKYYERSWGGNQYTGSRAGALKAAKLYRGAGWVTTVIGGGIDLSIGIYEDSRANNGVLTLGYHTGEAAMGLAGSIGGAAIGTAIGSTLGGVFGVGVGAIPGSVVGGIAGTWIGGWIGNDAGVAIYNDFIYYNSPLKIHHIG